MIKLKTVGSVCSDLLGSVCSGQVGSISTGQVGSLSAEFPIYRLFCPFKATCILEVESYVVGQEITVIAVKMSPEFKLVYIIQNKAFYHHYFMIISKPTIIQTTFN
jgi:hypothetical protein